MNRFVKGKFWQENSAAEACGSPLILPSPQWGEDLVPSEKLYFRQEDIYLAAGEGYEIRFLRLAPGPCRNKGKSGRSRADGNLALPLFNEPPDSGEAGSPALIFIPGCSVKQGLINGIEITSQLEAS